MSANENKFRVVETGIEATKMNMEIMSSVLGQLSDGIWEECGQMKGYWACADVCSREGTIKIDLYPYSYKPMSYGPSVKNRFYDKSDDQVLMFFARKIKQIVRFSLECHYEDEIRRKMVDNSDRALIPVAEIDKHMAQMKVYREYLAQNPFCFRGKFTEENNEECPALSYDCQVTVRDAVKVYKTLTENAAKAA